MTNLETLTTNELTSIDGGGRVSLGELAGCFVAGFAFGMVTAGVGATVGVGCIVLAKDD